MYSKVKDMTYELLCVLFHGFQELVARLSKMKVLCLCLALWGEMSSLTSWGGQKTGQWCFVVVKTKTWYKSCWTWADKTQLPSKTSHNLDRIMFINFFVSMHIDLLWSSRFILRILERLSFNVSHWVLRVGIQVCQCRTIRRLPLMVKELNFLMMSVMELTPPMIFGEFYGILGIWKRSVGGILNTDEYSNSGTVIIWF